MLLFVNLNKKLRHEIMFKSLTHLTWICQVIVTVSVCATN